MENEFVLIPETVLPNGVVVPSFEVSRFVCSRGDDGKVASTRTGKPWVRVRFFDAQRVCAEAGYKLITNLQWLSIAYHIAAQPENWTGGEVGKGELIRGLHKGSVCRAQPASYEPPDPDERRWYVLASGERIYDLAGNVLQWVFNEDSENGLLDKAFTEESPFLFAPYPSLHKGTGWRPEVGTDWSGYAPIRGGYWSDGSNVGPFLMGNDMPLNASASIGFRCTK